MSFKYTHYSCKGRVKSFEIQWSSGEIVDFTKKISKIKIRKIMKLVYFTNTEKVFCLYCMMLLQGEMVKNQFIELSFLLNFRFKGHKNDKFVNFA